MKLNIFKQNELLEEQKQRKGTLKEIGFKKILNEVGIILENTISEDIEITELKQKELKKIFEDKYKKWSKHKSKEVLCECVGILEALTFIGIKISVPQDLAYADLNNRCSD